MKCSAITESAKEQGKKKREVWIMSFSRNKTVSYQKCKIGEMLLTCCRINRSAISNLFFSLTRML